MFAFNKRVISILTPPKIVNKQYKDLEIKLFEETVKDFEQVLVLNKNQIKNIDYHIKSFNNKKLIEVKNEYKNLIFNYGKSGKYISNYMMISE